MDKLSEEQEQILNYVKEGKNVIVDAVAGTGKTTLILSTANDIPDKRFLQMTYNSMLRCEVKEKIQRLRIPNIKVHTFHSLAVRHYMPNAHTDTGIRYILCNKTPPIVPIPKVDVIVLDEAQDMSLLYFQLMSKVIYDMGSPVQLFILGDYMQGLYEFKGSDIRFLTLADIIWKNHPLLKTTEFQKCTMNMSFRITNQMCSFVNTALLGRERMRACRDGQPVTYIRNSRANLEKVVIYEIGCLLDKGIRPSDIFVLGASVKGINSNIRKMENVLVEKNIPCHVPMFEHGKIDERVIDGKVVFSTFHCVKGRQRKYVFIVGFDNSYLSCFARSLPRDRCPNTLYVGCTRATHDLYLLESDQWATDRPLDFLQMNHHDMIQSDFIRFKGTPRTKFFEKETMSEALVKQKHLLTPTELIKFLPESVIEDVSPMIDRIFISETAEKDIIEIEIPNIIETKAGFYEDVSDLNGITIPAIYYDYLRGLKPPGDEPISKRTRSNSMTVRDDDTTYARELFYVIDSQIEEMKENQHAYLKNIVQNLPRKLRTISEYLRVANVSVAVQEKLYFKVKQIDSDEYTWLSESMMVKCRERLDNIVGREYNENNKVEYTIIHQSNDEQHVRIDAFLATKFPKEEKFRFTARVDAVTDKTVWELKCTSKLSIDHLLQVIIYAWLWKMTNDVEDEKQFKILNIKTGEVMRLNATMDELNYIMNALLQGRFSEHEIKTDEEFILQGEP